MQEKCKRWLGSCTVCQRFGPSHIHFKLIPLVTDHPFQVVAVDFIGPLLVDGENNKFIFSIVDTHIRYVELIAVAKQDAITAVECVKSIWVKRWGVPLIILSDAGQMFQSEVWKLYWSRLGVKVITVPPYMQRANGSSERLTQTIL